MKKEYDGTSFSVRLKVLMSEQGLTQQGLAEVLNISRQSVSQYLDGSAQPSIDKLYKLAEYFECSADYLLGLDVYKTKREKSELEDLANSEYCISILKTINQIIGMRDKEERERLLSPLQTMFAIISMYADNIQTANSNYSYLIGDVDKMLTIFQLFSAIKYSDAGEPDFKRLYISQRQIDGAIAHLLEFINLFTILTFDFEGLSKEGGKNGND